jgi:hypothetical protein
MVHRSHQIRAEGKAFSVSLMGWEMKQVEHESTDVRPRHHTRSEPKARQCILGQLDGMGDDDEQSTRARMFDQVTTPRGKKAFASACTHTHTTTFSSLHRVQICKTALDTHPPFSLSRAIIHTWWAFDLSLASAASAIVPTPAPRANGVGSTGERQWAGLLIS